MAHNIGWEWVQLLREEVAEASDRAFALNNHQVIEVRDVHRSKHWTPTRENPAALRFAHPFMVSHAYERGALERHFSVSPTAGP